MTKFQSLMISSLLLVSAYGPGDAIQSDLASDAREPSSAVFAAGYVGAWTAFSLGATLLQWGLHGMGRLSPMMATTGTALGGSALIATGMYQWTPLKGACLQHCQSPLQFISQHWRPGPTGALRMGWEHGLYCLGCC